MKKHDARVNAMKLVYEQEMGGCGGLETIEGLMEVNPEEGGTDTMFSLYNGVMENQESLDEWISGYLVNWTIDRISRVDLAILRVAAYELQKGELPAGIVINEAVEIAKEYSTDKAGRFVNGVLGNMMRGQQKDN